MSLAEKTEFPFFDFPIFRYSPGGVAKKGKNECSGGEGVGEVGVQNISTHGLHTRECCRGAGGWGSVVVVGRVHWWMSTGGVVLWGWGCVQW